MSTQLLSKVRSSASLILLVKDKLALAPNYDYNVLLFTRTSKSTFMPDSSVFPGGVCDAADSTPAWLTHFQRYGYDFDNLSKFFNVSAKRPSMFNTTNKDVLDASLSLRLTAIRETFEEMGVLLCRDRKSLTSTQGYAQFHEQFDRTHWQHAVHNDANKFLTLCELLDVVPDVWALHEWSAWLTPSTFKKRFTTAFFLTALQEVPSLHIEPNEVKDYALRSPIDYLQAALRKELWLPPPQFYELSRCLNFKSVDALCQFAQARTAGGLVLMHPVQYKCTDGLVHLLPGDDMYPANPDSRDIIDTNLSIESFRAQAPNNVHRSEHRNKHESQLLINFEPIDGQVNPLNPRLL